MLSGSLCDDVHIRQIKSYYINIAVFTNESLFLTYLSLSIIWGG